MSAYGSEVDPKDLTRIEGDGPRIYVLVYRNATIKVGFTEKPKIRLVNLRGAGRAQSNPVARIWLSVPHRFARTSERRLINFCAREGRRPDGVDTGEYFMGLDFDTVVGAASATVADEWDAQVASDAAEDRALQDAYVPDEACLWAEKHQLICESLIGEVLRGSLVLIDARTGVFIDPRTAHDWSRLSDVMAFAPARLAGRPGGVS